VPSAGPVRRAAPCIYPAVLLNSLRLPQMSIFKPFRSPVVQDWTRDLPPVGSGRVIDSLS
jgi:hypothetical protein